MTSIRQKYFVKSNKQGNLSKVINILFVGNSFTFYNDMPNTLENIGKTNGYSNLNVEHVTYGGTTLEKYATPSTKESKAFVAKMNEKDWDYVILQDHSSRPYTNPTSFNDAVATLTDYVKGKGSQVILYATWAYRDGSSKLEDTGLSYTAFYEVLRDNYLNASIEKDTLLAPVGTAFNLLHVSHPNINLLDNGDDFHPNKSGSYVAAYVFYSLIFGSENNNEYTPSYVPSNNLATLREAALNCLIE